MTDEYRMEVSYSRDEIVASLKPDFQLSWLSYIVEQGVSWFLGRGIWKFEIERSTNGPLIVLKMKAATAPLGKGLTMSCVANLGQIYKDGYFPENLEESFRLSRDEEFTVAEFLELDTSRDIAFIAYGISDTISAFFLKGAEKAWFQISLRRVELCVDLGMEAEELKEFIGKAQDYTESTTVGDMPWRITTT